MTDHDLVQDTHAPKTPHAGDSETPGSSGEEVTPGSEEDTGASGDDSSGDNSGTGGDGGTDQGGGGGEEDAEGSSESNPAVPEPGEIVINELMINPSAVSDDVGEWVEIVNDGCNWVDLYGLVVGDLDVDSTEVEETSWGSLIIGPGLSAVLCASSSRSENGGVTCAGEYFYQGFGGGLALSNTEDEVIIWLTDGTELDMVTWTEDDAPTGASLGLDPQATGVSSNDSISRWCAQRSAMSGGDDGTPGRKNDDC